MNPIPNPITVNTGEQEEVTKVIDDFFVETRGFIEKHYRVQRLDWQIKSGELAYHSGQITDDRITYLAYRDSIIASIFETRTEFNRVQYTFFRNLDGFEDIAPKKIKKSR
jgi:hypothetical protein